MRVPLPIFILLLVLLGYYYMQSPERAKPAPRTAAAASEKETGSRRSGGEAALVLGSGGVNGVFYPTAGAIAEIFNRKQEAYNLRILPRSTGGSVYNIQAVMAGDLDLGITQASTQYNAVKGTGDWSDAGPQRGLRSIGTLFYETLMLIAADDSGIQTLRDLRNKRVSVGNVGSGTLQNVTELFRCPGFEWTDEIRTVKNTPDEAVQQLHLGKIDAFFFNGGHPSGLIRQATLGKRKVHFVPITGVEEMIRRKPYYKSALIPIDQYPNASNSADVPTIGDPAMLIASETSPPEHIYALTKEIVTNLETLKDAHPALWNLSAEGMLVAHFAPTHAGARKYFSESGLLQRSGTEAELSFPTIGNGMIGSFNFEVGGALVRLINSGRQHHGLRMASQTTDGPVESIYQVIGGGLQCALAGAGDLYAAYRGTGPWKDGPPLRNLRSICSLYTQNILFLVSRDSGIHDIKGLSGRRIGVEEDDSGLNRSLPALVGDMLKQERPYSAIVPGNQEALIEAFGKGQIDAMFLLEPYGNQALPRENLRVILDTTEAAGRRAFLLPLAPSPETAKSHPFFIPVKLPEIAGDTAQQDGKLPSLGISTILFTANSLPPEIAKTITSEIMRRLSDTENDQPILAEIGQVNLFLGLPIPIHAGVQAYLAEQKMEPPAILPSPERRLAVGCGTNRQGSFRVGGALARVITSDRSNRYVTACVAPNNDAWENIRDLLNGKNDFAVIPSTRTWEAWHGRGRWAPVSRKKLRSICTLYVAPLTLLATVHDEDDQPSATRLAELEGRRVSMPLPDNYGFRGNVITLFNQTRFNDALREGRYIIDPEEPPIAEAVRMFRNGRIEAFFCTVAHPSPIILDALGGKQRGRLLPITGLHTLISEFPYYTVAMIPGDHYPNSVDPHDVGTIGVPMNLVASQDLTNATAYSVMQIIDRNRQELHSLCPSIPELTPDLMQSGLIAPLHPGALQYMHEAGYILTPEAERKLTPLVFGTASASGVFYPVGSAIQRIANTAPYNQDFRLLVTTTGGSKDNCDLLIDGAIAFGLVETTTLFNARNGKGRWSRLGPQKNLRSVCSLHKGYLMLIAAEESGIRTFRDIAGKRVNVSNPGSGTRGNVNDIFSLPGNEWTDSVIKKEMKIAEAINAFRDGRIDAFFFNVGLQSEAIYLAVGGSRKARFVTIPRKDLPGFFTLHPGYAMDSIPVSLFPKVTNTKDVRTVVTPTVLVTSDRIDTELVATLTRSLFENIDKLRKSHPALSTLTKEGMTRNLIAPLHDGTRAYLEGTGILPQPGEAAEKAQ